ncbi:MAG: class I SAM-dependent methyltransferase [Chloroflexota bacterium]
MAHLVGQERALYVQDMFTRIAGNYDLMNRLMTAGQDVTWRRYVIHQAQLPLDGRLLDIATGTGEIALEGLALVPGLQAVGGDFTVEMMQVGRQIPVRRAIRWVGADTLALPFPDDYFDAVTSGFLMRNVIDVHKAFSEQMRVLKPGGRVVVLESSPPKRFRHPYSGPSGGRRCRRLSLPAGQHAAVPRSSFPGCRHAPGRV